MKHFLALVLVGVCWFRSAAAERVFDFSGPGQGQPPADWKPLLAGKGPPAEWKLVLEDVPPLIKPRSPLSANVTRREVLAQVSRDPTDERFPMLVFEGDRYGDFSARVRFKLVDGVAEQMAGLVFRLQDENNFYVVRASGTGNLRFYKFVHGQRSAPIGPDLPVARGVWHELFVKCVGNQIEMQLDGQPTPTLTDNSHLAGRIGLFTKSDAVSYFSDLRLDYRPLESLAQVMVRTVLADQPRLVDLQVYGRKPGSKDLLVLAAKTAVDVGKPAGENETRVWVENRAYYSKNSRTTVVTQPLHDRNGEPIGVARITLKSYKGQLEAATLGRVLPIVKGMEERIGAARELTE